MKKLIALILILAAAGAVFFLGWAQLAVPPGSYGVLRSKTHGVDPAPVREGEFRWVWYKLIPTNVTVAVFTPRRVSRAFQVKGALPQGDSYASLAGIKADFSYEMSGSFSFNINPGSLPSLLEKQNITGQDGLEEYENRLAGMVEAFVLRRLQSYEEAQPARAADPDLLRQDVSAAFPDVENFSCTLETSRFPDFALYDAVKSLYENYLERQRDMLQGDIASAAARHLAFRGRFDELEKYGELLTRYPVLLQYLALERGNAAER